ncbi:MAG: pyridoxamine 5'-phosphate oxidase family protein [Acidimicrobiia bacterium]|nr:pyridoxamine 5'-phosphate oxidase family protein [Acidimicrobiia bacterium]
MSSPNPSPSQTLASVTLLITEHQGMDVLEADECLELLRGQVVGRLGISDGGQPIILPINYALVAGSILFRTAPGSKLDIAQRTERVAFEIDDWDEEARTGWSVLVKGRAYEITDEWFVALCEHFGVEPWADQIPRTHWIRVSIEEVSGRWIFRDPIKHSGQSA